MTQCYTKNGNISKKGGGSLKKKSTDKEVSKRKGVSTMCIKKSLLFVMYFVYD